MDFGKARPWPKGRTFDGFSPGQVFEHHWGRTINAGDNSLFSTLTLHFNPLYFNAEFARAHGHPDTPVNPLLVLNTVLGLSVEDLSEAGGPFLGIDKLVYLAPVYPGDTLTARSTTLAVRESQSRADAGIVTWRTEGRNQRGETVIEFERSNLVRKARGQSA
ncbi:MAG: MaoC family dehydratase [Betaproteobacteria bacterium]